MDINFSNIKTSRYCFLCTHWRGQAKTKPDYQKRIITCTPNRSDEFGRCDFHKKNTSYAEHCSDWAISADFISFTMR
jgi:hypothetical protein